MMQRLFSTVFFFFFFFGQALPQGLPIKPARTITINTDEGSYMNVDVSPDGKTLVFDLLGELFTLPVEGGKATQITHGLAINRRPIWSPDGKRIAYLSDASGSAHLTVRGVADSFYATLGNWYKRLEEYRYDPIWTPEGNFISLGDTVYGLAGSRSPLPAKFKHTLQFSLDDKAMIYMDTGRIYRYEFSTDSSVFLGTVSKDPLMAAISPDGRWCAFVPDSNRTHCLIVKDLVSNEQKVLIPALLPKKSDYRLLTGPPQEHFVFSKDSKCLYIAFGGKIHCLQVENGNDRIIPFVADAKVECGAYNYNTFRVSHDSLRVKYTRSANASPDGKHLVFSALDRIYFMDIPNGKPRVLVDQPCGQFQPVYSPDGKWVAYVSWTDSIGGGLWRVPSAGGTPEQLSHTSGQYQRPAWSPDGKRLAVIRGQTGLLDKEITGGPTDPANLEILELENGSSQLIDDSIYYVNILAFSPDGKRIVYDRGVNRRRRVRYPAPQLVSRNIDGSDLRVLAIGEPVEGVTTNEFTPRSLSPDGRFIVYSSTSEDLYIVPVTKLLTPILLYSKKPEFPMIRFAQGIDPFWEDGGKTLSWSYANHFYRVGVEKILTTAEQEMQRLKVAERQYDGYVLAPVTPDQIITLSVSAQRAYGQGSIALKHVKIITMQGEKVVNDGVILIKDGRFIAVGVEGVVSIPQDAKIFDLAGTTVMPGLIDLHMHYYFHTNVFPRQLWKFLADLAYGTTTAREPSTNPDSYGYAELLETGQMIGPRLFPVGRAFSPNIGLEVNSLDEARALVQKRVTFDAIVIKQYTQETRIQRQWVLVASHEAGLNMTNEGEGDFNRELEMIKDGSTGVEHSPSWGDVHSDVINFIPASKVFLTPTLQVSKDHFSAKEFLYHTYWRIPDEKFKRFIPDTILRIMRKYESGDTIEPDFLYQSKINAIIRKKGGRITLGSHGEDHGIGVHNELWALQAGGLTNMEALQAATIMGAEALGIQQDVGSIEVGKIADLIILNKNPLDDIHNSREIRYVMKDGILYDGDTLDEIWPEKKKCPDWRLKVPAGDSK